MSQSLGLAAKSRIVSIDLLRGVVMVLMALDHIRDYFHYDVFFYSPTDLSQTSWFLFFTRFITHFCAPVFMFLAGTSAFFVGQRLTKNELSIWLIKRGIWLIIAEFTIIRFGWNFQYNTTYFAFVVIWALGAAMIFLALMLHVPKKLAIGVSLLAVFGHNALDGFRPENWSTLWSFLHVRTLIPTDFAVLSTAYPLIPWIFVMVLGYHFGILYTNYTQEDRIKWLRTFGGLSIGLFFVIRGFNVYGNLTPWEPQESYLYTVLSFFSVTKYPPSLDYLLVTLGPALLFLSISENWKSSLLDKVVVIGRVPMFFYIIHIYYIHLLAVVGVIICGMDPSLMIIDTFVVRTKSLQGYGFSLGVVYLVWVGIILSMYPLCSWYNRYKMNHREHWWLSYL